MSRNYHHRSRITLAAITAIVLAGLVTGVLIWFGGTGSAQPQATLAIAESPLIAEPAPESSAGQNTAPTQTAVQAPFENDDIADVNDGEAAVVLNNPTADDIDGEEAPQPTSEPSTDAPITPEATPEPDPTAGPETTPEPTPEAEAPAPEVEDEEEDFPDGVELPSAPSNNETIGSPKPPAEPVEPEPTPAPTPAPTPVVLELVEGVEPPVEEPPPEPPVDVPAAPLHGGPGGLASNLFGCELQCIRKATLTNHPIQSTVAFSMRTNVVTHKALWVLPEGPFLVGGHPASFGQLPTAFDPTTMDTEWEYTITGLEPDETYRIVVAATDERDNIRYASTLFTTSSAPPDDKVGNGSPCSYVCIDSAIITPGPTYDEAIIEIQANADVEFIVAVSTQQPVNIAGNPDLPPDVEIVPWLETPTFFSGKLVDLEPSTTYHVIARAEDDEGAKYYAVGEFETLPEPQPEPEPTPEPAPEPITTEVFVRIERAFVYNDGDTFGRGEIGFRYGFEDTYQWHQAVQKVGDGDGVHLGGSAYFHLPLGGEIPRLIVNAYEVDGGDTSPCVGIESYPLQLFPQGWDHCGHNLSIESQGGLTLDFIQSLPQCGALMDYGLPNDRCLVLDTELVGADIVGYHAVVLFRVTL